MRRVLIRSVSRWVWLINGVILLVLLIGAGFSVLLGWLTSGSAEDQAASPSADSASVSTPVIRFDLPETVEGTNTRIVLVREGRGLPSTPMPSAVAFRGAGSVVNVAFLDPGGGARLLLDRPARVFWVSYPGAPEWESGPLPSGPGQRLISYAIATTDTNGDGRVDLSDDPQLYMSSLEGTGLRSILPSGLRFEGMRALQPGLWMLSALEGRGAARRQRAFVFSAASGELRPYVALDSVAGKPATFRGRPALNQRRSSPSSAAPRPRSTPVRCTRAR